MTVGDRIRMRVCVGIRVHVWFRVGFLFRSRVRVGNRVKGKGKGKG